MLQAVLTLTGVGVPAEMRVPVLVQAAARERELAASAAEVVVEEAVTEQAGQYLPQLLSRQTRSGWPSLMPASAHLSCCNFSVMVAEQAPAWDKAGFHRDLLHLVCNLSTHILLAALQVAHGGPQMQKPSPSSPTGLPAAFREVQPRPASPGHGSVSQAAAAVNAAPTAGMPAGALEADADAAGAEAAAAAREALQAEVGHS